MNTKLKFLKVAENDNNRILGRNNEQEMKKHLQKLQEKIEEIWELKYKVQEQIIESEKSEEEVTQWSADLDEGIAKRWLKNPERAKKSTNLLKMNSVKGIFQEFMMITCTFSKILEKYQWRNSGKPATLLKNELLNRSFSSNYQFFRNIYL